MNSDLHFFVRDLMDLFDCDFTKSINDILNFEWEIPINYKKIRDTNKENRIILIKKWADHISYKSKYRGQKKINELRARLNKGFDMLDSLDLDIQYETATKYLELIEKLAKELDNCSDNFGIESKFCPIYVIDKILG